MKKKYISDIKKKDDVTIYWNKVYEPDVISNGKKIRDIFIKNQINYKYFKGNILLEFQELLEIDGTPYKVFTPFWKKTEQAYINKLPSKILKIKKKQKQIIFFKKTISSKDFLPKND